MAGRALPWQDGPICHEYKNNWQFPAFVHVGLPLSHLPLQDGCFQFACLCLFPFGSSDPGTFAYLARGNPAAWCRT
jgi:hypothetical protein